MDAWTHNGLTDGRWTTNFGPSLRLTLRTVSLGTNIVVPLRKHTHAFGFGCNKRLIQIVILSPTNLLVQRRHFCVWEALVK